MTVYLTAFLASWIYVFTRSFQQLNVMQARYWFILPTSLVMGTLDVFLIGRVAARGEFDPWLCLAFGLGGGVGSMIAVWGHNKLMKLKGQL